MNFVQQLEECLRDLATAARQRHPGVKEASERAVLKLRQLQAGYVSAVRQAAANSNSNITNSSNSNSNSNRPSTSPTSSHPTTRLFQSSDLLHPFLLAANYPNADFKLLEISFRAIRLLMEANAIVPTDAIHILRVYQIQAVVVTAFYHRLYAKEIRHHWQQQQQQQQSLRDDDSSHADDDPNLILEEGKVALAEMSEKANASELLSEPAAATTPSSSWFSWGSSSNTTNTTSSTSSSTSRIATTGNKSTSTPTMSTITSTSHAIFYPSHNAVSSSTGQTGHAAVSAPHMEKLALEILSSLLQLLEYLREECDSAATATTTTWHSLDVWCNATALACGLWFYWPIVTTTTTTTSNNNPNYQQQHHAPSSNGTSISATAARALHPQRHTVQQAAHSTISQLMSLLFQTKQNDKLLLATWDDLLLLTESDRPQKKPKSKTRVFQGAFKLCKPSRDVSLVNIDASSNSGNTSTAALPPSPEFALELMIQIWKEATAASRSQTNSLFFLLPTASILKSMGVTMNLLQKGALPFSSVPKSIRVIQWTMTLIVAHASTYPNECRELLGRWIHQLRSATDTCRQDDDFEDGYVYSHFLQPNSSSAISPIHDAAVAPSVLDDIISSSSYRNGAVVTAAPKEFKRKSITRAPSSYEAWSTCLPQSTVWKTACVLEAIYHILDQDSNVLSILVLDDTTTVQALTEALSDFATVGTSCRDHILQVIDFCALQHPTRSIKPTIFRRAEQGIAAGLNFMDPSMSFTANGDKGRAPVQILGESIWLSLQGVLRIGECVKQVSMSADHRNVLFDNIFPPSLAFFQHFLKRFVGCEELVRLALEGYSTLADMCLPNPVYVVERKVLLTSLSKLSLPAWGKNDNSCQLQDHHVRALLCLLRIVHSFYDFISLEWEIVLRTFEELSTLDIASSLLTDEAYHVSLAISAVYGRFADFSTCFADESLIQMTGALSEICAATMAKRDMVGDSETILPERTNTGSDFPEKAGVDDRESLSGKIMSIGVRAIYGAPSGDSERSDGAPPRAERTKRSYYQDYRDDFLFRMSGSKYSLRTNVIGRIPFALVALFDTAMANMFRSKACRLTISEQLSNLAASSPIVRPLVMDVTTMLMLSQLAADDLPQLSKGPGRVVFDNPMYSQLLATEPLSLTNVTRPSIPLQADVLAPLCNSIKEARSAEVAKASLAALNAILEGTGQTLLGEVWTLIIDAITTLSGDLSLADGRSSTEWAPTCLMAFRCLKLIVDDFLCQLNDGSDGGTITQIALLDCCSAFVLSRHDINTSLTAIGLLWTIAERDKDSSCIDRALSKLVLLSSDDRPEVRNAAVNTLFSCIAGRGSNFSSPYWELCIERTVFKVYYLVLDKAGAGAPVMDGSGSKSSRHRVRLHHSRDSTEKMWVATQVLVLQGLNRILRLFFSQLLLSAEGTASMEPVGQKSGGNWFADAWEKILEFAFDAASQEGGRDSFDIRSVGVELIAVSCQLASKAGIQAAATPARVSTNMEVVNGALRTVRESQPAKVTRATSQTETMNEIRFELFASAFDSLESFNHEVLQKRSAENDTDLQIISKFCGGLGRVFDCCRENEFQVDNGKRSLQALINFNFSTKPAGLEEALVFETRFICIVVDAMNSTGIDAKARYLNQGQRASLDILKTMAAYGSSLAFEQLVRFAGSCIFIRQDSENDETDNFDDDVKCTATLLNFEAASAVSQEISKDQVSDECKVYVLYMVLHTFLSEPHNCDLKQRRNYKRFVPIVRSGLRGAAKLCGDKDSVQASILIWAQILRCLSQILLPIPLSKGLVKIPRVPEVISIISICRDFVPDNSAKDLCGRMILGASQAFEASKQHSVNADANPESEFGRKSKRHRDDLVKLFSVCFSGCCALWPEEPHISKIANLILTEASSESTDSMHRLYTEAGLLVCQALLENGQMDLPIISIFPSLCRLIVTTDDTKSGISDLRDAASALLIKKANFAGALEIAQRRYEDAETRATAAQIQVTQLEAAITELNEEKSELQQKLATALESRRGLWS